MSRISGENPWGRPIDVYVEKTSAVESLLERARTVAPNNRALTGHVVEAAIAKRYVYEATPEGRVLRIMQTARTYQHPTLEWAMATPDRFIFSLRPSQLANLPALRAKLPGSADWLLECKLVGSNAAGHWDIRQHSQAPDCDRVPPYVYVQVQWQMACTGASRVDVAGIFYGTLFQRFRIDRDQGYIDALALLGHRFWHEHVLARVPPPPDGSASYDRFLTGRYPVVEKKKLIDDPDLGVDLMRAYVNARQAETAAKQEKQRLRQALATIMGDAYALVNRAGKAVWVQNRGKVHWQDLAASLGAPADPGREWRDEPSRQISVITMKGANDGQS